MDASSLDRRSVNQAIVFNLQSAQNRMPQNVKAVHIYLCVRDARKGRLGRAPGVKSGSSSTRKDSVTRKAVS